MNTQSQVTPEIRLHDGKAVTTSTAVAEYFTKRHDDVLKKIRSLIKQLSPEDYARTFAEIQIDTDLGSGRIRKDPAYEITKRGFTLLAMGFTGEKALQFKLRYIDAFEAMEAALSDSRAPTLPMPEPEDPSNSTVLIVSNIPIRQDIEGRYCLNELHRAAGNEDRHHPRRWANFHRTRALADKYRIDGIIPALYARQGIGTFIVKELVYDYARWVGSDFHRIVSRAFDRVGTEPLAGQNQQPALALKVLPAPEPEKPTLQNGVLTATFDDGRRKVDVQFNPEAWINASAAGEAFGVSVQDWLGQESTLERIVALYQLRHVSAEQLIVSKRGEIWLDSLLAVAFAASLNVEFAVWCQLQIETLINDLPLGKGREVLRKVHMLVSYDMLTGKTHGIGLPNDYRVNTEEGFVDHMMKNGPHRLMSMIADYAAKGPSGRAI